MGKAGIENTKAKKKIINIVVNILTALILIFAFLIALSIITSSGKGYKSVFGNAYCKVLSQSMEGEFDKGDVISVKIINDEEKKNLKADVLDDNGNIVEAGDIITFWSAPGEVEGVDGARVLITHRIMLIKQDSVTGHIVYITYGLKTWDGKENKMHNGMPQTDSITRTADDIIGVYKKDAGAFGNFVIWVQGGTGFLICIVIPTILILIYCIVKVILNTLEYKKKKNVLDKEAMLAAAKDELREQIMREMAQNNSNTQGDLKDAVELEKSKDDTVSKPDEQTSQNENGTEKRK